MVYGKIFVGDIISNFCSKGKHMKIIYSTIQLITILGFGVILLLGCVKKEPKPKVTKKSEQKGITIDGNALNKAIKKNECMNVAKLLPADDRLKYLRGCGYFD